MNGSTIGGLMRRNQDTQIMGMDLFFTLRCQGLVAGTTTPQLFAVQSNPLGVAQLRPTAAAPYNTAPTASPVLRQNEAQEGLRFFATHVLLADPDGTLRTTDNVEIQVNNLTQNSTMWDSPFIVSPGAEPAAVNQASLYHISGGNGNTLQSLAVHPYDQLQVSLQMPGGSGTATGVTVSVYGIWLP